MSSLKTILRKISFLLQRPRFEQELGEEIQIHLEMKAEELSRQGLDLREARLAAQREFGNLMRNRELSQEAR